MFRSQHDEEKSKLKLRNEGYICVTCAIVSHKLLDDHHWNRFVKPSFWSVNLNDLVTVLFSLNYV